jgi:hypothetical protein
MVKFSPELCVKLFKYILRNITVQNMDIENVQCAGARYVLYNTNLIHYVISNSQNIFVCICEQYINIIQRNVTNKNELLFGKELSSLWHTVHSKPSVNVSVLPYNAPLSPTIFLYHYYVCLSIHITESGTVMDWLL